MGIKGNFGMRYKLIFIAQSTWICNFFYHKVETYPLSSLLTLHIDSTRTVYFQEHVLNF